MTGHIRHLQLDHQEEMVTDHIRHLQLDHQEEMATDRPLHQIDFKEDQNLELQKENLIERGLHKEVHEIDDLVDEAEVVEEKDQDLDFLVEIDNYIFQITKKHILTFDLYVFFILCFNYFFKKLALFVGLK
jgi:hypothetical protein